MSDFLRQAVWRLYLLYFRPRTLEWELRAELSLQGWSDNPVNLMGIVYKLKQKTARRYVAQVALWCLAAAVPFIVLAPFTTQPPTIAVLLLTFVTIWAIGLSTAVWDASLGPGAALLFALLQAGLAEPSLWWDVVTSADLIGVFNRNFGRVYSWVWALACFQV